MSLAQARTNRNIFLFLLSNMIFKDGLVALFAFGGIYAAGQLGWGSIEIGTFGIILTITGTLGLLLGGPMDDRFGAKPVIVFSLIVSDDLRPRHDFHRPDNGVLCHQDRRGPRGCSLRVAAGTGVHCTRRCHRRSVRSVAGLLPQSSGPHSSATARDPVFRPSGALRKGHQLPGPAYRRRGNRPDCQPTRRQCPSSWSFSELASCCCCGCGSANRRLCQETVRALLKQKRTGKSGALHVQMLPVLPQAT